MASSPQINQWNEGWRTSPMYAELLAQVGVTDPSRPFKLSDAQRKQLQGLLESQAGQAFPKGVEIDSAGNMNENEGFGTQAKKWGPVVGAIAVTLFGIPGVMPGVLSGGGGAAAGGAAGAAGAGGGGAAGTAAAAGGGFLGMAGNLLKGNIPAIAGMAGRALTGSAEAQAANRGAEVAAMMDAEQLNQQAQRDWYNQMVQREQAGMATRNDAWKALQQGAYVRDWKAPTQKFSPYTRDLVGPSEDVRAGGGARAEDARTRLTGYTLPEVERRTYDIDPRLLKGGGWEKAAGIAGTVLEGLGGLSSIRNPRSVGLLVDSRTGRPVLPPTTFIDPENPLGYADDDVWSNIRF